MNLRLITLVHAIFDAQIFANSVWIYTLGFFR